jgi:hypothetical protein
MSRFILKNISTMDVYVPSPNGAGRRVPPSKCVEGSFFKALLSNKHFQKVNSTEVNNDDIICKYVIVTDSLILSDPEEIFRDESEPVTLVPEPVNVTEPEVIEEEEPKSKKKELNKLNLSELKLAASGIGIVYDDKTTRRQLINALVAADYKV